MDGDYPELRVLDFESDTERVSLGIDGLNTPRLKKFTYKVAGEDRSTKMASRMRSRAKTSPHTT